MHFNQINFKPICLQLVYLATFDLPSFSIIYFQDFLSSVPNQQNKSAKNEALKQPQKIIFIE